MRPLPQRTLAALPAALLFAVGTQIEQPSDFGSRLLALDALFPLRLVLATPEGGARVPLDAHNRGRLLKTQSHNPRGTAVVMHGNNRLGSKQPSSIALHGALMRAGYDVLSVDHPGFGESRTPDAHADWSAWDPAIAPTEALSYIHRKSAGHALETILVGHSMGVDVALKLIADGANVQRAYLFGGSLDRPYGPNWLPGFHRQRRIPCCLPESTLYRIRDEFYGGGDRFAEALPEDHAPVEYVRFGIEHADVTRDRELLYASIPSPKKVCDLSGVSHYFNTLTVRRFALLDARAVRRVADLFARDERADAACESPG